MWTFELFKVSEINGWKPQFFKPVIQLWTEQRWNYMQILYETGSKPLAGKLFKYARHN